jgi:hypothetical protein
MAKNNDAILPMDFTKDMPTKSIRKGGLYDKTVEKFLASGKPHAQIGGESTTQSRYLGLKKAIERLSLGDKVGVRSISGEIWLYIIE